MDDNYWENLWNQKQPAATPQDKLMQVRRTLHGQPITQDEVAFIRSSLLAALALESEDRVLDLCCGNGLLTLDLAQRARSVVAVDFARPLLASLGEELAGSGLRNVTVLCEDAMKADFAAGTFSKVVMAGALQHFSLAQTVTLFSRLATWLAPGGRLLVTDIPDQSRQWAFHDTPERAAAHFRALEAGTPILGTWFSPEWLERLARFAGFSQVQIQTQPPQRSCAGYRLDLLAGK